MRTLEKVRIKNAQYLDINWLCILNTWGLLKKPKEKSPKSFKTCILHDYPTSHFTFFCSTIELGWESFNLCFLHCQWILRVIMWRRTKLAIFIFYLSSYLFSFIWVLQREKIKMFDFYFFFCKFLISINFFVVNIYI